MKRDESWHIRTLTLFPAASLACIAILSETRGDDWLTPDVFRFGASTLADDVVMQIAELTDGNCHSSDYLSQP